VSVFMATFGVCQAPSSVGNEVEGQGEAVGFAEFVRHDVLTGCSCEPKTTPMHVERQGHV
jgi:hypothetical protein